MVGRCTCPNFVECLGRRDSEARGKYVAPWGQILSHNRGCLRGWNRGLLRYLILDLSRNTDGMPQHFDDTITQRRAVDR